MRDVVLGVGKYWDAMYELSGSITATHIIRLAHIKYKQSTEHLFDTHKVQTNNMVKYENYLLHE